MEDRCVVKPHALLDRIHTLVQFRGSCHLRNERQQTRCDRVQVAQEEFLSHFYFFLQNMVNIATLPLPTNKTRAEVPPGVSSEN